VKSTELQANPLRIEVLCGHESTKTALGLALPIRASTLNAGIISYFRRATTRLGLNPDRIRFEGPREI